MSYLSHNGLTKLWNKVDAVFARLTEAAHSLSWSGTNLTLKSCTGSSLSTVDLRDGLASDSEAGHTLSITGRTITLNSVSGTALSSVSVPEQSLSGYATQDWVKQNFFASASISVSGNTFTITFCDGNGTYEDSVSFTVV